MVLMGVLGLLLLVGLLVTGRWGGTTYLTWQHPGPPSSRGAALGYLRGVAVALVGGFWAGALVTGPAVRLIMRLLAVTAGDDAQGRLTEADEVVGDIALDGTIGLFLFGGVLPGLVSGAIYVLVRRWLPPGRLGGLAFGGLHLVIAATRIDPLRPENPDFDIVGPGWLSVATFGATTLLHGMAVVAIANRYSTTMPPREPGRAGRLRAVLPLIIPTLLLVPGAFLVVLILVGLVVTVAVTQIRPLVRGAQSRVALVGGRIGLGLLAVVLLPGTVIDLGRVVASR